MNGVSYDGVKITHANGGKITDTTFESIFDGAVDRISAEIVKNYSLCMIQQVQKL